jgi:uncharacterized membrane protein
MNGKRKNTTENNIFWGIMFASAVLFYFGFDAAAMAAVGITMLVYGAKDLKVRRFGRAALLFAMGALILGVAIYERFF